MWPSLPFIILLVAGLVPPDTGKAPPATKPTITAAPFKITQSTRVQRDGGDWEAGLPVEFWFEGNYGASIPFIRVESVYRFDPPAFFKDGRLVRLEEAVRWAHEQRESERWQGLLADEEDGDFYSAMLFPKLEVTEERDVITATTGR